MKLSNIEVSNNIVSDVVDNNDSNNNDNNKNAATLVNATTEWPTQQQGQQ